MLVKTVKPILMFPDQVVHPGYNVGGRGNGVDQPKWPEDLLTEIVANAFSKIRISHASSAHVDLYQPMDSYGCKGDFPDPENRLLLILGSFMCRELSQPNSLVHIVCYPVNFQSIVKQESRIQKKGEFQGHTLSVQESNPASAPSRPL